MDKDWLERVWAAAVVHDGIHSTTAATDFVRWLYKEYGMEFPH